MAESIEIKPKFRKNTAAVNSLDLHPDKPWILAALQSGGICIWNYDTKAMIKEVSSTLPAKSVKFLARKLWIVVGAEDFNIYIFNYDKMVVVANFVAHTDRVTSVCVHPFRPLLLSASNDHSIKLWNWEEGWTCLRTFEGHSSCVTQVTLNPESSETFASTSHDGTIKIWHIESSSALLSYGSSGSLGSLTGVCYAKSVGKQYLVASSQNTIAVVWDYVNNTFFKTLIGHTSSLTSICFVDKVSVIVTCAVDGVRIWDSTSFELKEHLKVGLGGAFCLGHSFSSRRAVIGCEKGLILLKMSRSLPVVTMTASGQVLLFKNCNINSLKMGTEDLSISENDQFSCHFTPKRLEHNFNGSYVSVSGEEEYAIYDAVTFSIMVSGAAIQFAWFIDGDYAILENTSKILIFDQQFQLKRVFYPPFIVKHIFGGAMLAVSVNESVYFYDRESENHQQDMTFSGEVKRVYWAGSSDKVVVATAQDLFVLDYNPITHYYKQVLSVKERILTGFWVGRIFIYNNSTLVVRFCVGIMHFDIFQYDQPLLLLGYSESQNKIYMINADYSISFVALPQVLLRCFEFVDCGDIGNAILVMHSTPEEYHERIAVFMESKGCYREALQIAKSPDLRAYLEAKLKASTEEQLLGVIGDDDLSFVDPFPIKLHDAVSDGRVSCISWVENGFLILDQDLFVSSVMPSFGFTVFSDFLNALRIHKFKKFGRKLQYRHPLFMKENRAAAFNILRTQNKRYKVKEGISEVKLMMQNHHKEIKLLLEEFRNDMNRQLESVRADFNLRRS